MRRVFAIQKDFHRFLHDAGHTRPKPAAEDSAKVEPISGGLSPTSLTKDKLPPVGKEAIYLEM